ncbi:unnamed protein product [Amoebophrya sp. A25]|nr:unnamed protein product [Amoebophrya sp. A25]|eukprot:GSA25T00006986001.1
MKTPFPQTDAAHQAYTSSGSSSSTKAVINDPMKTPFPQTDAAQVLVMHGGVVDLSLFQQQCSSGSLPEHGSVD